MKFFGFFEYIKSWSVWVLGVITALPLVFDQTTVLTELFPNVDQNALISVLGVLGLIVRAIKQR